MDAAIVPEDAAVVPEDAGHVSDAGPPRDGVAVLVTLDDAPAGGVLVVQGGTAHRWRTGPDGRVQIVPDETVIGEIVLIASHPDARIRGALVEGLRTATIALTRFDRSGNPDYVFQDPGEPARRPDTRQCGHCHQTINDAWFASPHRTTASNPHLRALYPEAKALDPTGFGGCADCHAPGMQGGLSGRDLDDATGLALDYGVHCDVCHRVEAVNEGGAPAFGGWFEAVRPTEEGSPTLGAGGLLPLTFGPSHDSPNVRMGSVQRDHFREAQFCGGCHQLEQPEIAAPIDRARWPSGRLPVHTTFGEWKAGALFDVAPCQACHMPPAPEVANAGDVQLFHPSTIGIAGGWFRPPGSVRHHSFVGPRTPSSGLLELSGAVFVEKAVQGGELTATVRVKNAGAGHGLPTGEPFRSVLLRVDAECQGTPLDAIGGDAVPSFGGYVARKLDGEDWSVWSDAQVGDVVRVVRLGPYLDYSGFGPFGDGTFDATEKNLRREEIVGKATVTSVGPVAFDAALPAGDVAYLVRADVSAGRPGFAFARVMIDADGNEMVPHFAATDVAIDNRLLPHMSWTTVHSFASPCPDPTVTAGLIWRRFPLRVARDRGWDPEDRTIVEVRR